MAIYNFKKETKLYIVFKGNQYNIDISDISFSQTFTEHSYEVKTLHNQNKMFEGSVINKANPAHFEFNMPAIQESDFSVVLDLLLKYSTTSTEKILDSFDLYIATKQSVFKLDTCVITNGAFLIEKSKPLGLTISGEAAKLSQVGVYGVYTIPGILVPRSSTVTYSIVRNLSITLNSVLIPSDIYKVSVELQNDIAWVPYTTIQAALLTTGTVSSMYPSEFSLKKRILAGSFSRYVTDSNDSEVQQWDKDIPIHIQALDGVYGFDFNISSCSFTNRLGIDAVYTQSYDWRMTQNPTDLSSVITYN